MNIVIVAVVAILLFLIYNCQSNEGLCIKRDYGYVTDVPASVYTDANMALVHSTGLGQAPLGDPRFWLPNRSPITQGMYGLYQSQPFDRSKFNAALQQLPVYTDKPLPPQCKPLN